MVEVMVGGKTVHALVDTGCSTAVVRTRLVDKYKGESCVTAFDGRRVKCRGATWIDLKVHAMMLDNIVHYRFCYGNGCQGSFGPRRQWTLNGGQAA